MVAASSSCGVLSDCFVGHRPSTGHVAMLLEPAAACPNSCRARLRAPPQSGIAMSELSSFQLDEKNPILWRGIDGGPMLWYKSCKRCGCPTGAGRLTSNREFEIMLIDRRKLL